MKEADLLGAKNQFTRRRLLEGAGVVAAAAAAGSLMPPNVQRALAQGFAGRGSLRNIKHIVLLMQENRSFDHYFGTLAGVRGFNDPKAIRLSNGKPVFYQPDSANPQGYLLPFHLDTRASSAQKIPSTSHAWTVQHEAWNGGKMDQWLPAHRKSDGENGPYCMGHYTRDDIPFHYALADTFTLCDAYHCSVMGPTHPNRLYWFTGTIDPHGLHGGPVLDNETPDDGFTWTTYAERLEEAGISWKVYQLEHEPQQETPAQQRRKQERREKNYLGSEDKLSYNMLSHFRPFIDAPKGSPLYTKAMMRGPVGQFEYDALHDKLPAVSWIMPLNFLSEHPDYLPADGATFIASIIDAIASIPDVWAKTLFVLNYDENDGMFDHVPPPVPPPGTADEFVHDLPIGAGFRVPCILISPWTTGGWVCSEQFDHTSVLQLLEKFTGVREPNISAWRRRTFGDLTSAFRIAGAGSKPPVLPDTKGLNDLAKYEVANLPQPVLPGAEQRFPTQEKGSRKHKRGSHEG